MEQVCELNDILCVSDEVVTSFGRLGHFFSSTERFDDFPDMIVTAKGITSGYMPFGATLESTARLDNCARPVGRSGKGWKHGRDCKRHPERGRP